MKRPGEGFGKRIEKILQCGTLTQLDQHLNGYAGTNAGILAADLLEQIQLRLRYHDFGAIVSMATMLVAKAVRRDVANSPQKDRKVELVDRQELHFGFASLVDAVDVVRLEVRLDDKRG